LCSVIVFSENRAVYDIMWKNMVERGRTQMTIWRMRIACRKPKTTDTLTIRNTYSFPHCNIRSRTRLKVTSHAHSIAVLLRTAIRADREIKVNIPIPDLFFEYSFRTGLVFRCAVSVMLCHKILIFVCSLQLLSGTP